jgi:hypothetical protein
VEDGWDKAWHSADEVTEDPPDIRDKAPPLEELGIVLAVELQMPKEESDNDEREALGPSLAQYIRVYLLALLKESPPVSHELAVDLRLVRC